MNPLNTIAGLLVLVGLTFGVGCAKSDWIERTLVTVDVTGTWSGRVAAGPGALGGPSGTLWFDLKQKGATVKGLLQYEGGGGMGLPANSAPIDGTVTGDVFRFKLETAGRSAQGELTVTGDEMSGQVWLAGGLRPISLQRADPSTRPPR
jgi:hypothetical protein